ncbi:tetratricopeptide repeat protein [Coprococcus sp. OM06-25]|nr:tetratricopeptide repeat protein [Coprococcus sp. OM06-25]
MTYEAAIDDLNRVLQDTPNSDVALFYKAMCYLKLSDDNNATLVFNQLVENCPNSVYYTVACDYADEDAIQAGLEKKNSASTASTNTGDGTDTTDSASTGDETGTTDSTDTGDGTDTTDSSYTGDGTDTTDNTYTDDGTGTIDNTYTGDGIDTTDSSYTGDGTDTTDGQ